MNIEGISSPSRKTIDWQAYFARAVASILVAGLASFGVLNVSVLISHKRDDEANTRPLKDAEQQLNAIDSAQKKFRRAIDFSTANSATRMAALGKLESTEVAKMSPLEQAIWHHRADDYMSDIQDELSELSNYSPRMIAFTQEFLLTGRDFLIDQLDAWELVRRYTGQPFSNARQAEQFRAAMHEQRLKCGKAALLYAAAHTEAGEAYELKYVALTKEVETAKETAASMSSRYHSAWWYTILCFGAALFLMGWLFQFPTRSGPYDPGRAAIFE